MVRILSLLVCWSCLLIPAHANTLSLNEIRAMAEAGRGAEALPAINAFTRQHPGNTQAQFLRGVLLAENKQHVEALAVFRKLTRDHPELPEPHNNLAVLYASSGEYVKARDALLVAINTHPSYATAHENLGDIYAKMAGIAYDQALQFDNTNDIAKAKLNLVRDLFSISQQNMIAAAGSPVPAPSTVQAQPSTTPPAIGTIEQAILAWAGAWSAQEVDSYLSFYDGDFVPPRGLSRRAWERNRRFRLAKPTFIDIDIQQLHILQRNDRQATASFVQSYRSNTFEDKVEKTLALVLRTNGWKIVAEGAAK